MRILAISGSLRRGSHNTGLLRALREEAPDGVEVAIWDGLKELPALRRRRRRRPGTTGGRRLPQSSCMMPTRS